MKKEKGEIVSMLEKRVHAMTAEAASLKVQLKHLRKDIEHEYKDLIDRYERKMAEYD